MGINKAYFQGVYTAGEDVYYHLLHRDDPWYSKLGDNCYFIGPSSSHLIDDIPIHRTDSIEDADFILITGPDDWHQNLSDYQEILDVGVQMDLPMICANPILLEAETGPSLVGKDILLYYEQAGGFIKYHGKPDKRFFMKGLEGLSDGRGLVIGDSLYFDMKGAQDADMDSAFVACGIHEERLCNALTHSPDLYRVETYYRESGLTPKYTLSRLVW